MKSPLPLLCLIALGFASTVPAQDWQQRFYGRFDIGGSWIQDTDVRELFGAVDPGSTAKFDPGLRLGVGAGYNVTDWFAGEFELGMLANGVKSISGADSVDATLWNFPILVSAKVQVPNRSIFTPYLSAGVGGASTLLDVNDLDAGGVVFWGTASDFVFAYQAVAGVRVDLNENMSLGVEYRYLHTDAPDFSVDWGFFSGSGDDHLKFGALNTQSVSLLFQVHF